MDKMKEKARLLQAEAEKRPPGSVFTFGGLCYITVGKRPSSLRHTNPYLRKLSDQELAKAIEKSVKSNCAVERCR